MTTKTQQARIAKGLCPNCGKEAAPYYLCGRCREIEVIGRMLRRAAKHGAISRQVRDGAVLWSIKDAAAWDSIPFRAMGWDLKETDKRRRPRIRGVPVDVEKTIIQLLRAAGKPCSVDEIIIAWGRLRAERKGTVVGEMTAIIAAQRKRERKAARRAELAGATA